MPIFKEGRTVGFSQFVESEDPTYQVDCVLIDSGVSADTYGHKVVPPGTTIAKVTQSDLSTYQQCVVKAATPDYGAGSDVAHGLLRSLADLTLGPKVVTLMRAGRARKALVTDEGTLGTVQDTTRTQLSRIEWV
jgi:hypothetical protein